MRCLLGRMCSRWDLSPGIIGLPENRFVSSQHVPPTCATKAAASHQIPFTLLSSEARWAWLPDCLGQTDPFSS